MDNELNIEQIFETWIKGYAALNVDQVMSVFDRSIRFSESCIKEQTFDSLTRWYKFDFARSGPRPGWTFKIESSNVSGDLAVVISNWNGFTDLGTPQQAEVRRFRSVDLLRLGADGWKIFRTINVTDPCFLAPPPVSGSQAKAKATATAKKKKKAKKKK